jgi:hypothetical protein
MIIGHCSLAREEYRRSRNLGRTPIELCTAIMILNLSANKVMPVFKKIIYDFE